MLQAEKIAWDKIKTTHSCSTYRGVFLRNVIIRYNFPAYCQVTKLAPDRFFGLFKRQFRRATVDTMQDIMCVVKESSISGNNIPYPTIDPFGNVLLNGMTGLLFIPNSSYQYLA